MKKRCILASALFALTALTVPAWAKHKMNINLNDSKRGDVVLRKGETVHDDLVATGSIKVYGTVEGDCASLGGSVLVAGKVNGDVATLGGSADVTGTVNGDLSVVGGSTHISGTVRGGIDAVGGDVTLDENSEVDGDIALEGGKLHKAPGAVVKGEVKDKALGVVKAFLPLVSKLKDVPALSDVLSPWKRFIEFVMFCIFALGMGVVTFLLAVFVPKNVEAAAGMIKQDFWKCGGVGALILILTGPGLFLMTVSIIGIPLVPVAVLVYAGGIFMALAALGLLLTNRLCEVREQPAPPTIPAVAVGYGCLVILFVIGKLFKLVGGPGELLGGIFVLANLVLLACGLVVGMGAVWLTRMGTVRGPSPAQAAPPAPPPNTIAPKPA